ncbi:MAG TPA: hypothetical protein PLU39_13175 [Armatimonadota bacterium]|nr:hypothetical protein [Armatimonadota bacterium]HPT98812.1 hypothetical protein [Armatimonadota bacterium]
MRLRRAMLAIALACYPPGCRRLETAGDTYPKSAGAGWRAREGRLRAVVARDLGRRVPWSVGM